MLKVIFSLALTILALLGGLHIFAFWVDGKMNSVTGNTIQDIPSEVSALHSSLMIGDLHADSTLWSRDIVTRSKRGHIDLPRLRDGNVAIQIFTSVTKSPLGLNYNNNSEKSFDTITLLSIAQLWPVETWFSRTQRALYQAEKVSLIERRYPDQLKLIQTRSDIENIITSRNKGEKIIGAVLGIEGMHALDGESDNIDILYEAGFRVMGLHHFFDNKLGGSLHGESNAGLTTFGKETLLAMLSKDIIIDLAHSSEQVVKDVLARANAPVIVSHTGFKGHCDTPRNISDELMIKIAERGGLIGVGYWDAATCGSSIKSIVESIRCGINLVGINSIALGSDFDGAINSPIDVSDLPKITAALLKEDFTSEEIRKVMGENLIGFLKNQLPLK